jgi:magnesium-transporting ATPase (P-type)
MSVAAARAGLVTGGRFEREFARDYPALWWATLVGPFALSAAILVAVGVIAGWEVAGRLLAAAVAEFFVAGRFIILGGVAGAEAGFLDPWQLALMAVYIDVMCAVVLACHAGVLFRLPLAGDQLRQFAEDGQALMDRFPAMRRLTFAAVFLFVLIPFAASGSIAGSILGRLLGMKRLRTFLVVTLGSVTGVLLVWLLSDAIARYVDITNPWLAVGGGAAVVVLLVLLNWWFRRQTRGE